MIESDKFTQITAEQTFAVYRHKVEYVTDTEHYASRHVREVNGREEEVWRVYHGDSRYPTLIAEIDRAALGDARTWSVRCSHCPALDGRTVTVEL